MQNLKALILATGAGLLSALFCAAQPQLSFNTQVSGFTNPVDIVAEPGTSRLFVVEQGGLIRIADGNTILPDAFLDIAGLLSAAGGETGLLSMAFHPDYSSNRYFFVYYNNTAGAITLARYRMVDGNSDLADAASGTVLLTIPKASSNHNGGKLHFGADGYLYFGTGDGGGGNDPDNNSQNGNSLLGKMLRIDVNGFATAEPFYAIPADNPFAGDDGIRDEIWALGLRNPWRWSFDRQNGDMWIADVGENAREEINFRTADNTGGVNYGWRCYEGTQRNPEIAACDPSIGTLAAPLFEYGHDQGQSITGGYVYRGSLYPAMRGYYICADFLSGNVWLVQSSGAATMQSGLPGFIATFGEGNDGELYAASRSTGTLYQLDLGNVLPLRLLSFNGEPLATGNMIRWKTVAEENIKSFVVEYSKDGLQFTPAGTLMAQNTAGENDYQFLHKQTVAELVYYRLQIQHADGSATYSSIISLNNKQALPLKVFPTSLQSGQSLQVTVQTPISRIQVLDASGQQVYAKEMNNTSGYFTLPLPALRSGLYYIRLSNKEHIFSEKIIIR